MIELTLSLSLSRALHLSSVASYTAQPDALGTLYLVAVFSSAVTAILTSSQSQEAAVTRHGAISVIIPYGCFVALCVSALSVGLKRSSVTLYALFWLY